MKKVIVIGAGLGGMSAAISLRSEGYDVEVYEKNSQVGGKLNLIEKDGFSFDLGPSIFTLPQMFESLFQRAGKKMSDYVEIEKVTPHWRNFFEDGKVIDLYEEQDLMKAELAKLGGDIEKHWSEFLGFLDYAREQYKIIDQGYFEQGLDNLWEMFKFYVFRSEGKKMDWKNTMSESIAMHFSDDYMRRIFEYFIKYVGSSAKDAPGYMNLMPIIQFDYGLWYVKDGMYNLARGMEKLMNDLGIRVHLDSETQEITKSGKKVTGIRLSTGEYHEADYVISNMEVIPTYEKLLKAPNKVINKYEKFAPACSGLVIHIGTDKIYPQLAHHNFFFSKNQDKHFDTVFQEGKLPDDPTIYLVAPTRTDESKAPAGHDNIKILPHIPPISDDGSITHEDYMDLKERVIDKLERMGLTDLRKHIVVEDTLTPVDIQKMYYSNKGSIYGVVSDWKKNYGFKAPKTSKCYKNLYFTGGSVNPGGGMPMVVLCGQKVADRIIKNDR